jgi:hypothetical protein
MLGSSAPSDLGQAAAFVGQILNILGTVFLTVLTFVLGQIFMKFAEPAFEPRREIGTIAQDSEMYSSEDDRIADVEKRLEIFRSHASKLHGIVSMILGYEFWQPLFQLPQKENVLKACGELRRLSGLHLEDKKNRTIPGPYATGLRIREAFRKSSAYGGRKGILGKIRSDSFRFLREAK